MHVLLNNTCRSLTGLSQNNTRTALQEHAASYPKPPICYQNHIGTSQLLLHILHPASVRSFENDKKRGLYGSMMSVLGCTEKYESFRFEPANVVVLLPAGSKIGSKNLTPFHSVNAHAYKYCRCIMYSMKKNGNNSRNHFTQCFVFLDECMICTAIQLCSFKHCL